jgi:chromosomal replication initiator protein
VSALLHEAWPEIQAHLRRAVPEATYRIWLSGLEPRELHDGALLLAAPDSSRAWIADRFGRLLQACVGAVLGPDVEVTVVGGDDRSRPQGGEGTRVPAAPTGPRPGGEDPNPRFTFDQFVIGAGNRLAHAAALAVAELPGQTYNPLYLCGPPGVGKTHLLHAIASYVRAIDPQARVRLTTVDRFTSEFVGALQSKTVDAFKAAYRHVDVLLVDDVQFLAAKARTEDEFFHTFTALHESGAQIVLSSDRMPRDLDALQDRLRERFAGGLVADITPPDFATRMTILRKRADVDEIEIPHDALAVIADRVPENVRALEGALIRVVAHASLSSREPDAELTTEVLDTIHPAKSWAPRSVRAIQEATCAVTEVGLEELISSSRAARVARPRQIAMYLARELTDVSLPAIGTHFGGRDHATVLYAHRQIAQRLESDEETQRTIEAVKNSLTSSGPVRSH